MLKYMVEQSDSTIRLAHFKCLGIFGDFQRMMAVLTDRTSPPDLVIFRLHYILYLLMPVHRGRLISQP